ncbi:hypothetical protein H072_1148 [Dactylellina haptotyla CBS 200.50]|uniref:Uncharacterized protein n=1 Tax=Dactylellina haptotyla (strain CBS 200.50) TaxID=1284197 RepID=S8CB07_DACHA|nr:hypothetical protein H072_1148 [Dactylellina haptotyla CBS 200.50]
MPRRSFLATVSIGAILVIILSIRTGLLTAEGTEVYKKWNDLTTDERLERVREQNLNGYQYAAPDETYYEETLSAKDKDLLRKLSKGSNDRDKRVQTIERLYQLDSEDAWNRHLEDLDDEGLPPLTKFTQRYIYDHQHPKNCSEQQFLVMRNYPNDEHFGLGAAVFSVSMNLNIALRYNRILIYDPAGGPGKHFIDPSNYETCGKTMDCFFESLSSCTVDDLTADNHYLLPAREVLPDNMMETPPGSVPQILGIALRKMYPMITPDALKYWWRGQAVSYIMRFNARTLEELLRKRRNKKLQKSLSFDGEDLVEGTSIPFPMPAGSVSMHVRHGDKGIEMKLKPFKDYLDAAEKYISQNPMGYRKIAFLSTENPDVIKEASDHLQTEREKYKVVDAGARTTSDWTWTWYWSDIPRANIGPEAQLETFGNRTDMTINWFLQLMMAIECDMMIGTRASGWSRLLDNLRCGWLGKCQQAFLDIGDEQDWVFYGI